MKRLLSFIILLSPFLSYGELLNCGYADVDRLIVQGDREGTHGHENTLLASLKKDGVDVMCSGKNYIYIENTDPAYQGMLSVLLAAQMSGKQVNVFVNTTEITGGNAVEIAFIALSK